MNTITVNGVEYIRKDRQDSDVRYNDLVEVIKSEFATLRENAELSYRDFSNNGFAVNTIEAEGFLRGVTTAENFILEQIRYSSQDEE